MKTDRKNIKRYILTNRQVNLTNEAMNRAKMDTTKERGKMKGNSDERIKR